jgi:CHAD domain-containing protein
MSRTTTLDALLQRRLDALHQHLLAALEGDVAGVHQARVASRRLREVLPILRPLTHGAVLKQARDDIRKVTRLLGPVRELDVALGHLAEHLKAHPDLASQVAVVKKWLERTRSSRRDEMLAGLGGKTLQHLWRRVDGIPALATDPALGDHRWRAAITARLVSRADALTREMQRTGILYDAHALHLVRIATKKLRYVVEVAGELRLGATAAALRTLKRQQELLGDIHDLEVLMGFADRAIAEMPARARVARLVGEWQRECRELHARYLRSRATVVRVAEYAGGGLAHRVAGPRVRVARRARRGTSNGR